MPAIQSAPRESASFGQSFRAARLAARRSVLETATLLGCSSAYVCMIEDGKRGLDRGRVALAARLFEVDPTPLVRASVRAHGKLTIKTPADLPDVVVDFLIGLADQQPANGARSSD
jgi:transcriptional regulator with XRE-family HTH domain